MNLPHDMKDFSADAFQIIEPEHAGIGLLLLVLLVAILEPVL